MTSIRLLLAWIVIIGGVLEILLPLLRREPRLSGVAYGRMLAGTGWVVAGLGYLDWRGSTAAQIGAIVGLAIAVIGLEIRRRAGNSSQV